MMDEMETTFTSVTYHIEELRHGFFDRLGHRALGEEIGQIIVRAEAALRHYLAKDPDRYARNVLLRGSIGLNSLDIEWIPRRRRGRIGIGALQQPFVAQTWDVILKGHVRAYGFRDVDPRHVDRLEHMAYCEDDEDGVPRPRRPVIDMLANDWRHYRS